MTRYTVNFTSAHAARTLRREAINQEILVGVGVCPPWRSCRSPGRAAQECIATRLAAREALRKANNQLERGLPNAPHDLRASNERLKRQIRERRQAEETLRRAQDELVQAGKLAAIGQMSTSIAHELNQPLAALRTLSGNTVRFLERGQLDVASTNLKTINELIDRMGRITASLRSFARRGDDKGQASLGKAVDAALQLLGGAWKARPSASCIATSTMCRCRSTRPASSRSWST